MYIVTFDRPYYPRIQYFETLAEAQAARDSIIRNDAEPDGEHDCKVTIALVQESTELKTHY